MTLKNLLSTLLISVSFIVMTGAKAKAGSQPYRVIHLFGGNMQDAWVPIALPAVDKNGDIYGTTLGFGGGNTGGGTIFKLAAPQVRGGSWIETLIYKYPMPGKVQHATAVTIADNGNIYGAEQALNTRGLIFEITPPSPHHKAWKYKVIHRLTKIEGSGIEGNFAFDAGGNLYAANQLGGNIDCGVDGGCGSVFELRRPAKRNGKWHFRMLHIFNEKDGAQPFAGVVFDKAGNLLSTTCYGGTNGWGTVYRMSPPAKKRHRWTEEVLYSFDPSNDNIVRPDSPLTLDGLGNIYGTTEFGGDLNCQPSFGCGVVFELSPPSLPGATLAAWTYKTLYEFQGGNDGNTPIGYTVFDSKGSLYGTTQYGGGEAEAGTIYQLMPDGDGTWTETVIHGFKGSPTDGAVPVGGLTWGKRGGSVRCHISRRSGTWRRRG